MLALLLVQQALTGLVLFPSCDPAAVGSGLSQSSSHLLGRQYVATQDIGKHAPSGSAGDGYRGTNIAVGPGSSHRVSLPPLLCFLESALNLLFFCVSGFLVAKYVLRIM